MKDYRGIFSKMGEQLVEKYIEDLKKELEQKPNDPELLFKLGVSYARLKKTSQAREVYNKLKQLDSQKAKELLDMIYEV
ncbi:tetratricopeptide repeat protein [Thermocrinis sp.]